MPKLDHDPNVAQLARELGLGGHGDWLSKFQAYAIAKIEGFLKAAPVSVSSVTELLRFVSERLSVKIEYVREDEDLHRIARDHDFSVAERKRLLRDLNDPNVDGLLIHNPDRRPGSRYYLAVVDSRGAHAVRAYFTAWHEVVHLIVTPPQRAFEGVYRTISVSRRKDPEESVVDAVTGQLAFYAPLVRPMVEKELEDQGGLTLEGVERIRQTVAPEASFYAAAIAAVRMVEDPLLLVQVKLAYKKSERRRLRSAQVTLDLGVSALSPTPKLRAVDVIPGGDPSSVGLRIFSPMRVPEGSVLTRAFQSPRDVTLQATEDQAWWETSTGGSLPDLPLRVQAMRRGDFVYGIIAIAQH